MSLVLFQVTGETLKGGVRILPPSPVTVQQQQQQQQQVEGASATTVTSSSSVSYSSSSQVSRVGEGNVSRQ